MATPTARFSLASRPGYGGTFAEASYVESELPDLGRRACRAEIRHSSDVYSCQTTGNVDVAPADE